MATKAQFRSRDFTFRPTALGDALRKAGIIQQPHLVREAKREGLLKAKHDKFNVEPSVLIAPLA